MSLRPASLIASFLAFALVMNVFGEWVSWSEIYQKVKEEAKPKVAQALSQYGPTGGAIITGTTVALITSGATSGNVGSWRGTLASDNFSWNVSSTASGFDQQIQLDGSSLNNANKLIVTMEAAALNTTLQRVYQICDWTSSTEVDNVADAQCTTGGWRTMNIRKTALTTAADTTYIWHVYDGFWATAANANVALSTPLSNFIRGSDGRILLRAYAPTNCTTCTHSLDYVRVDAFVDPIYMPSGAVTSTASTFTNGYKNAQNALFAGQSASDNNYLQVQGTVSVTADFYMKFTNVRTYPGMNTIMVRAEYSCTTTGINHRPKIWNFNSSAWEDLTSTSIACSATDATSAFAKNNITVSDYISSGEIRIGWRGLANSTVGIRIDQIYVMVGSVNADSAQCEISFGTGTATDCVNTRTLDTTAALSTWQQTTEVDGNAMSSDQYGQDSDQDATANEHGASANLWIPASVASTTRVTGLVYAMNWRSNATTITTQGQFKDFSGANATISGGWTPFGTTNAATSYTYQDSVTNGYFGSNPDDYLDTDLGKLNVRIRTTVTTAAGSIVRDIDYVFASVQWAETTPTHYTLNSRYVPEGGTLVTGTNPPIVAASTTLANMGSWKGTLATDSYVWRASSTASGLDQQLYMDNVEQNNANRLSIVMAAGAANATLSRLYQICDWSSSTEVDNVADAQCTGGGWRTLNIRKVAITTGAITAYTWAVYDGFWATAANANVALSTPLSNFINTSNGRVLLRAYSTTNCTTCVHYIDSLRVDAVIDPIYGPAGAVTSTASTFTNGYKNAQNALFTGQSASDNNYLQVQGTASVTADFYMRFKNVKTYSSMNAILVRAEYSCTATGLNHRPKIWNFTSSAWEDLTSTSIACATGDTTSAFAKSNVNVNDYISNNEIRIGWRGLANSTVGIRIDMIYVMLGSVNDDSAECEISFGTGTAANCANTRSLDTTATLVTWQQTSEAESTTFGHDYYGQDNDGDGTNAEHGTSANLWFPAAIPANAQVTARTHAVYFRSNATTMTMFPQLKDMTGANATISGGWTNIGTSNALTTYSYIDTVTNGYFTQNPEDYDDAYNGRVNMRFRTSVSTAGAGIVRDIDFAMVSLQWVEAPISGGGTITLTMNSGSVGLGALSPGTPIFGTSTAVVDVAGLTNGYSLLIDHEGPTSTLMHSDAVTSLPDYTDWNSSGSGNATSTPGNTFSFRVSTSTANFNSTWWGSGTPLFAGIPVNMDTIMNCTSCNTGITTSSINYRAAAANTQKQGAYNGTSTYTAVTNP